MKHPTDGRLALYAGGDLNLVDRVRTAWHVRTCDYCRREVKSYKAVVSALRYDSSNLPAGVRWESLAAEMTANIHVGVEAGECVGPISRSRPERMGWRAAAVMACMTVLLMVAWYLNPPPKRQLAMRAAGVAIRTTPGGLEVNQNGNALTLMHTRGKALIVSAPGTLRARFVDSETGQVTINNVYAD